MPTVGQSVNVKSANTGSFSVFPASNVTAGNLFVLGVYYSDDLTTTSVNDLTLGANKDVLGNTWNMLGPVDLSVDGDFIYLAYSVLTVSGADNIRFLASSGLHTWWVQGWEVTPDSGQTFALDQSVTTGYNASSNVESAGTQNPTTTSGFAVVDWGNTSAAFGGMAYHGGFGNQLLSSDVFFTTAYNIYATNAALTPSATGGGTTEWGGVLALFKQIAAGGGSNPNPNALLIGNGDGLGTARFVGNKDGLGTCSLIPK